MKRSQFWWALPYEDKPVPPLRPNPPMHPAPLRVDKIGVFLCARISYNLVAIYACGAGDGQTVGPLIEVYTG